jgi:hypothetical protein
VFVLCRGDAQDSVPHRVIVAGVGVRGVGFSGPGVSDAAGMPGVVQLGTAGCPALRPGRVGPQPGGTGCRCAHPCHPSGTTARS